MTVAVLLFTGGSLLTGAELFVTLPAMLVVGLGGGLALNVSTTVLQEHNGVYGPAMLSLGNAAAAGVGLVTPLAVGAATAAGLDLAGGHGAGHPVRGHRLDPDHPASDRPGLCRRAGRSLHGSPSAACRRRTGWPPSAWSARSPSSSA